MNCDKALQIMLDTDHNEHRLALGYLLSDPACLARVEQLGRAILSDLNNELSCAEARLHLADYYEQQSEQGDSAQIFPDLHAHLERCPDCRFEYQLLQETITALATDVLPTPDLSPTFDLSFIDEPLPRMTATDAIWMLHDKIRTLFQQLEITITKNVAAITTLTPQLAPATFSMAMRGGEDDIQFAVVVLPDEEAQIYFQVDTKPFEANTAFITLRIFATETDSPLSDVRVTLRNVSGALVTSSLTDLDGEIQFPGIIAAGYIIQAHYEGRSWEIPITVTHNLTGQV